MKVIVLGSNGMVGRAVSSHFISRGFDVVAATRHDANLVSFEETQRLVIKFKPDAIVMCAAKVGGIVANRNLPADFIEDNLAIQSNVFRAAYQSEVNRLIFLGSSCVYPRDCPQPILEEYLLTGPLEETNRPYAIAKIAGIETVKAFRRQYGLSWISIMPCNLYGNYDNFEPESSHVIPALIKKFVESKRLGLPVELWGTGRPRREFLHVSDLASAIELLLLEYDGDEPINVGSGSDISIKELAALLQKVTNHKAEVLWNDSFPDGTPRKLLDSSRIRRMNWSPRIDLESGIQETVKWFNKHYGVVNGH